MILLSVTVTLLAILKPDKVNVHAAASLKGIVTSENLTVETGATIDGEIRSLCPKEK